MDAKEITWTQDRMRKHLDAKEAQRYLSKINSKNFKQPRYPDEMQNLIREKVTELPSEQLVVIYLTFWENLCEYEIAKEIKTTVSKVINIKEKALLRLKELMAEDNPRELCIA
jgi:DNA-directed RNA polymerase specialized sigma subunit